MEAVYEAGPTFERIDPITGEVASRSRAFTVAEAQEAADRAEVERQWRERRRKGIGAP